jgi:hypothetical protein
VGQLRLLHGTEDLLIPPEQFSLLASTIVSSAGNQSLLTYLETNTIAYHQNGVL